MSGGGIWNEMRETNDERTIEYKPMQGWVTNNADSMHLQRVQVRVHVLHDDIEDADLPWFVPEQLSAYSGAANIGDHGPIPQVGAKVWVQFKDKSQYHGTYGGGVATTTNQIPEFAGKTDTPVALPGGTQYNYKTNYPSANGGVDGSGSFSGSDEKTDVVSDIHVSGTGHAVDGKGNMAADVNGGVTTSNQNAQAKFPTGGSFRIFGNMTLYVSGKLSIGVAGGADISVLGTLNIRAGQVNINDQAPVVPAQTAPTPRPRPDPMLKPNDTNY